MEYTPNGPHLTKKKSNFEIIAAGVVPTAASMVPVYFANVQMKQQIKYMTDYGIYQKQQDHYFDYFNNYYNTQWLNGYGNPFDTTYMMNNQIYPMGPQSYNFMR